MQRLLFSNWPVFLKLLAAFAAIMCTLVFASTKVEKQYDAMQKQVYTDLGQYAASGLLAIAKVKYYVPLMRVHVYRYSFFESAEQRKKISVELEDTHNLVISSLAEYRKTTSNPKDLETIDELKSKLDQYWVWVVKTKKVVSAGGTRLEIQDTMAAYTPLYNQISVLMNEIVEGYPESVKTAVAATGENIDTSRQVMRDTIITASVVSILALLLLSWSVGRPIRRMARQLTDLSVGDVSEARPDSQRLDEIGKAERGVFLASQYLRDMASVATKISEGDLTTTVQARGSRDVMGNAFASMVQRLNGSVHSLMRNAGQIVDATTSLKQTSLQLDSCATAANRESTASATAMERVNSGIQTAATAASEMSITVQEMGARTEVITQKVSDASQAAEAMSEAVESVDGIANLISGIAEQTHLLALNATIEAARAGDAGRGFAVVAQEVSELAAQTGDATGKITQLLSQVREHATLVRGVTNDVQQSTEAMSVAVGEQRTAAQTIGFNMDQAARESSDLARIMNTSVVAVGEAQNGAHVVNDSASSLSGVAAELQETVSRFRVAA